MSALTNFDILRVVEQSNLSDFRGVFMRDTLPKKPKRKECGIVNLNTFKQPGSHWVCYYKDGTDRIYFDSFGQITPIEIQTYLKTKEELDNDLAVIQRNTDIVQHINTEICGQLCLFVLDSLSQKFSFQEVIDKLRDGNTQGDW